MRVKIKIPKYLQSKTNGDVIADVEGSTLGESIEALIRQYPGLKGEILDSQGVFLLKWMIYINRKRVASSDGLSDAVQNGDVVELLPLVAGG